MNKSCVAACLESVRMAVESVSGCSWNECPDQRGITVRMCVEWVSESAWNPQLVGDVEEINLGYRLARMFWHQGYATEAVKGVLQYAFDQKHCESVIVIIEPEHTASVRVTEKVGFGDYTTREFHARPVRVYRMSRDGWALHNKLL